tara:strand:- start:922 stop:1311 length:390 start_codon:yes stop_codon:yes gene_type:complete
MIQENYLYFANNGENDADKDAAMFPASGCYGLVAAGFRAMEMVFAPIDGTETVGDKVTITCGGEPLVGTHATAKQAEAVVELVNSNRVNTNNFTVICDLNTNNPANEGAISKIGIADKFSLASCVITTT